MINIVFLFVTSVVNVVPIVRVVVLVTVPNFSLAVPVAPVSRPVARIERTAVYPVLSVVPTDPRVRPPRKVVRAPIPPEETREAPIIWAVAPIA